MANAEIYIQYFNDSNGNLVNERTLMQSIPFTSDPVITEPKVKNELGKAGSFEFGLEYGSPFYNAMRQMKTIMYVKLFGRWIFRGRVLTIDKGMARKRVVHCEGDLTFLLDSCHEGTQEESRPIISVQTYLTNLLAKHNSQVEAIKQIELGAVPGTYDQYNIPENQRVKIPAEKQNQQFGDSSWNSTMDRLENLMSDFGGYLRTRYDESTDKVYLDWLDKYYDSTMNPQTIEVAKNLIDLSGSTEVDSLFTAVIPIGKKDSDNVYITDYWPVISPGHAKVNYITVPELCGLYTDDELNAEYPPKEAYSEAIERFGMIWRVVDFANAITPEQLFTYAKDWMKNNYMPELTQWDVSALDLHVVDNQNQALFCGDRATLTHPEVAYPRTGMTIISAEHDLYNPDKNKYTIGVPNQEINASYGVKAKASKSTSSGKASKGGGSTRKKASDPEPTDPGNDIEAVKASLRTQYSLKTDWGQDIGLDNKLAFMNYNTDGTEKTKEEVDSLVAEALAIANTLNYQDRRTAEQTALRMTRETGHVYKWNDPEVLLTCAEEGMTSLSFFLARHNKWKQDTKNYFMGTLQFNSVETEVLLNESESTSWLASLVDDDGKWTKKAYDEGIPNRGSSEVAEQIRQQAIRARKLLQGSKGGGKSSNLLSTLTTALGDIVGGNLNISDYLKFDANGYSFDLGSIINTGELTNSASGLVTKVMTFLNGMFDGNVTYDPATQKFNFGFELGSNTINIDGSLGGGSISVGAKEPEKDSEGKPIEDSKWRIRVNAPITYKGADGKMYTAGGNGFITADDFAVAEIPSFKTKIANIDTAIINQAYINKATVNELVAYAATLGTYEPKKDKDGNVVYLTREETDAQGNTKTVYVLDENGNKVPVYDGTAFQTVGKQIAAVSGAFVYETDKQTGEVTLKPHSGGGYAITRDGTEFGLYDSGSLTGGILVDKINGEATTKITGAHIVLGDDPKSTTTVNGILTVTKDGRLQVEKLLTVGNEIGSQIFIDAGKLTANKGVEISSTGKLYFIGDGPKEQYILDKTVIQNVIKKAEIDSNVLKLWKFTDADATPSINFSKATTLKTDSITIAGGSGTADDKPTGKITAVVNGYQTNVNTATGTSVETKVTSNHEITVGFGSTSYDVPLSASLGSVSEYKYTDKTGTHVNPKWLSTSIIVSAYDKDADSYNQNVYTLQKVPVNATTIWSNGYKSGWGKALGDVNLMPNDYTADQSKAGETFIVKIPNETPDGAQVDKTFTLKKGATPGKTGYASVTLNNRLVARISIGDWYEAGRKAGRKAGQNSVNITKGAWDKGVVQFTKSAGTASTKEVRLVAGAPSWSGSTATVAIWDGTSADAQHGSNTGYKVTVNAAEQYETPEITYVLQSTTFKSSPEFTVSANGKSATGWVSLYTTQIEVEGSYHHVVNVCQESDSTKIVGRLDIQDIWKDGFDKGKDESSTVDEGEIHIDKTVLTSATYQYAGDGTAATNFVKAIANAYNSAGIKSFKFRIYLDSEKEKWYYYSK